jgi:predicted dehydrogenase
MAHTLKVAVAGVGGIAGAHMPGWELSPHAEVVAGYDVDEHNLQQWGQKFGIKRLTTHYEDILNDPDIHIVDVCTPSQYHCPLTVAALNAGKHVLCEKPLAPTPDDVRAMIAARDRSGKLLMTAQHLRFHGASQALMAEIRAGALGDVYHARAWWLRRAAFPGRISFWQKQHAGGGACLDLGVHIMDLSMWFMGHPKPVTVTGVSRTVLAKHAGAFSQWGGVPVPPGADVEEFATAFIRFENGASLILETSWLLHHDTQDDDRQVTLYGSNGGAQWPKCNILQSNYNTRQLYNSTLINIKDNTPPHALECVEFAQAIIDGAPSPVPPEESLNVIAVLNAVYQSQESGREVLLDL